MSMKSTKMLDIDPAVITWDEVIPGGSYWSRVIKRGTTLRIIDLEGSSYALPTTPELLSQKGFQA